MATVGFYSRCCGWYHQLPDDSSPLITTTLMLGALIGKSFVWYLARERTVGTGHALVKIRFCVSISMKCVKLFHVGKAYMCKPA